MKKLLISSMFFLSIITTTTGVNAQGVSFSRMSATAANPYPEAKNKIVSEIDININAVRDFRKTFKKASDVKWTENENGASVYFTNNGMKMRTSYNAKGKREYTLKYYDESGLPSDMRHRLRSSYYDHRIAVVTEVTRNNHTYYLVKMENDKEYLTLRVSDEETSEFEKISKR